jgi:membrane protease YdiL (CAAX protease family)
MRDAGPAFDAYLAEAARGRESLWRLLASVLFIVVSMILVAWILPFAILGALAEDTSLNGPGKWLLSRAGAAYLLLTMIAALPLTALAVLGAGGRLSGRQFARAFAVMAVVALGSVAAGIAIDPRIARGPLPFATWLLQAPIFASLILLQCAAEEYLFRGYLVQALASRFRSPAVWYGVPTVLFALQHWTPGFEVATNAGRLAIIAVFAVTATLLVARTGNLGAAIGLHFANNLVYLLLFSDAVWSHSIALYLLPAVTSPGWTAPGGMIAAGVQFAGIPIVGILLLHRRSPFKIVAGAQPPAGPPREGAGAAAGREGGARAEL